MEQIMMEIQSQVLSIVSILLVGIVGYVSRHVKNYFDQKGILAKLEAKKKYVQIVVHAVEQMYKEADGHVKFNVAKDQIVRLLNEKKIDISEDELQHLIEAVIKEAKDSFK